VISAIVTDDSLVYSIRVVRTAAPADSHAARTKGVEEEQ